MKDEKEKNLSFQLIFNKRKIEYEPIIEQNFDS